MGGTAGLLQERLRQVEPATLWDVVLMAFEFHCVTFVQFLRQDVLEPALHGRICNYRCRKAAPSV